MALRVAVVGAGPAGFYAAGQLLASGENVKVDVFDRPPTPFGLVRPVTALPHDAAAGLLEIPSHDDDIAGVLADRGVPAVS
jgi:ferredoxin/flavodoxin---NADP+ reductase